LQGFNLAFIGEIFRVSLGGFGSTPQSGIGIIVNILRDRTGKLLVGALLLSPCDRISLGGKASGCGKLATVVLGDSAIGTVLDPVGNVLLSIYGRADAQNRWMIEAQAPGIIARQSVFEPLQTGILSVDAMIPIGRGQRELIVGDRQTGKTSIGVDTILNQKFERVLCVYVPIGQKASSVLEVFLSLIRRDSGFFLTLLVSTGSSSAVCQFLNAYTGSSVSEFFMYVRELSVFIMLDDLTSHAVAYREIYLLLRRPAGREAYPGEIFFVHSRLLERSAKLSSTMGGGSVSAFPVVQTLASDVSAYITTNVISITDGQLFLSQDLFLAGVKPSIDVGLSVTRVGSAAQWEGMKMVSAT
jgi:F-type H+-transporting ATPase subunit alpha